MTNSSKTTPVTFNANFYLLFSLIYLPPEQLEC